tara:strand:- start:44 stop:250 length:207 start_codon:yes stop_codon:yes gene_type:complete
MPNFTDNRTWGLMASLTNRINQKRMDKQPLTHEELRLIMQTLNDKDKQIADLKFVLDGVDLPLSAMED